MLFIAAVVSLLLITAKLSVGLRVVAVHVPPTVRRGEQVRLNCFYDLGNASLYSLKWFYGESDRVADEQEFFRYTPRSPPGTPVKQVFPLDGIQVDLEKSSDGSVELRVGDGLASGKYKCEISVEGTFQTVAAEKLMTVEAVSRVTRASSSLLQIVLFAALSLSTTM